MKNHIDFTLNEPIVLTSDCFASSIYFVVANTNVHNSQCTLGIA